MKKGKERLVNPPSVFAGVSRSYLPQTLESQPRSIKRRNIDSESGAKKVMMGLLVCT